MKYIALWLLFVCGLSTPTLANEIIDKILIDSVFDEKLVLCKIDFLPDSYTLSEQAKDVLDAVATRLEAIDTEEMTIRIEGFRSLQDQAVEPTRLSMHRALAVEDYFRIHLKTNFERFLTGHKEPAANCYVEIAIYNNPWQPEDPPVQIATKDN